MHVYDEINVHSFKYGTRTTALGDMHTTRTGRTMHSGSLIYKVSYADARHVC